MTSNTSKTICTSSVYGFIRLVHRRNNLNKETLIYIYTLHLRLRLSEFIQPELQNKIMNYYIIITRPTHISKYVLPVHIHE